MPAIIQDIYEEITKELGTLKTDKDKDQVIITNFLKLIPCLSFDVHNNIINMEFVNKVEVIKQCRQSVMDSEVVDFFISVIQNLQRLKIMTMIIVYEKKSRVFV